MELYEKIPLLRKMKGLTQSQLAESVDVSRQSVQKWESGLSSPDISKLPEIAALLGVSTDLLLDTSIMQEDLLLEVLSRNQKSSAVPLFVEAPVPPQNVQKSRRSMLDWLILVPVLVGVGIGIFMFYVFGAMAIGFGFLFSALSIVGSVWSAVAVFFNAANGVGAVLISVGGIFLGLGLCCPLFVVSKWWLKKYRILAKKLAAQLKSFDIKKL